MPDVFVSLAKLLVVATAAGGLALLLRQPLIVAFIGVGLLVGPAALGWVKPHGEIDLLAQIGVTILLFVVGLKLDLHLIRRLGKVDLATGIGQIVFTSMIGLLLALALGMNLVTAVYMAIALTFSSTIIIVKLLSDKREIDSLHGRIAMGFLIVQDIAVVLAMMLLAPTAGGGSPGLSRALVLMAVLVGNPLIVMIIMGAMGYRKRTDFLCGLTVAQISEFSIVFTALGVSRRHIGAEALGLVTLVGLITIALST